MPLDLAGITENDVADHMTVGTTAMIGVDISHAELVGKPLNQSPQGVCGLIKWCEAQIGNQLGFAVTITIRMAFLSDGSVWHMLLERADNGQNLRQWGNKRITGKRQSDIGFARDHELLGYKMILKLARRIANQLGL